MSWQKKGTGSTTDPNSHTHSNKGTLDKFGENNGSPTFNGAAIGGGSTTVSPTSNLILGGNVRFKVDFTDKTINFTTWDLYTSTKNLTLSAATKTFTTEMTGNFYYYVCYKDNTIELVSTTNIGTYTGYVVFAIKSSNGDNYVLPFSYPIHQIGVRGGRVFMRSDYGIGEWYQIGDSITFGGAWSYVPEEFYIPKITNLGVNGRRMAGAGGMWTTVDSVPATCELVTIMGGTNDQGNNTTRGSLLPVKSTFNTDTFIGAYQYLIEGLLTKNPKMRIILCTPPRAWTDVTGTTLRSGLKDYGDDVKAIGQFYNLPVLDTYNLAGWNEMNIATYLPDGLHPNDDGKRRLSGLMKGMIKSLF